MKDITDFKIGEKAEIVKKITAEVINKFVEITGDDNRIHLDDDFASKTSFKKPIAHGMLGASFISTMIGKKIPGDGAVWLSQSLDFLLPIRVGDTIKLIAEITNIDYKANILELYINIYNQHNQLVTKGVSKVKKTEFEQSKVIEEQKLDIHKAVLVIGATGGIGEAVCMQLAREGYEIIVHYSSNKNTAKKICNSIKELGVKSIMIQADITKYNELETLKNEIGRYYKNLFYIVNCATTPIANIKFEKMVWKDIQNHINVNVMGTFNIIKLFLHGMQKSNYGKIVLFSSISTEMPSTQWTHYITAKAALSGFAKAIATELAAFGIRVNIVSPGMTDTGLIADISKNIKTLTKAKTPLKRIALPQDIAGAVSFLLSDKSDFLAGETLRVNGGQFMI